VAAIVNPTTPFRVPAYALDAEPDWPRSSPGVAETMRGETARGSGEHFQPRPGWPSTGVLDYVQKFATASLLLLGLLYVLGVSAVNPGRGLRLLGGAARARVGA
jgi:hypothetical protein